ncbi:hypothetical protein LAZ67_19001269, partial [Cordylochernes scorpioides]
MGKFTALIEKDGRSIPGEIFVVTQLMQPLLSGKASESLNLIKRLQSIEKRNSLNPFEEYPKFFTGLGTLQGCYTIKLKDESQPHAIYTPRRIPIPLLNRTEEQLDQMDEKGVIEKVEQPTDWCAPMVIVPKPSSNDLRICVDLTALNKFVKREHYPIPSVEYTLAQMSGVKLFSRLDANSGFWQIPLSEESSSLTTFLTPFGRYRFKRLPFGISTAPETITLDSQSWHCWRIKRHIQQLDIASQFLLAKECPKRKLRTTVPTSPVQLQSRIPDLENLEKREKNQRHKKKTHFDIHYRARELPHLDEGTRVWVKDLRVSGVVLEDAGSPRSYIVNSPKVILRRNRFHLLPNPQGEKIDMEDEEMESPEMSQCFTSTGDNTTGDCEPRTFQRSPEPYKLKLNYNHGTIFQLGVPLSNTIYHFKHVSNECKHGLGQNLSQRTRTTPKAFTHGNPCLHSLPKPQIFTCHHSNLAPHNFSLNPIANTLCPQHIKPQRLQPTIPIMPKKTCQYSSHTYHTKSIHAPIRHHTTNTHNPHNKRNTRAKRQQQPVSACTIVKNNTIIPSTQNIEKIHATKQPHNRKTLRSFLKAVNAYKEFIPDHARLRTPLVNLLKKDVMWVWDDECQKAFTNLKENLTTHPTLHLYQEGLPCQVYCNTSTFSITGILKQVYPDGKTYTVQHFSRSLRSHERNYSDLELQCLAIVESVDNFRTCLMGRKFTIFSDHPALQWLKEIKAPSGRLFRWRLRLSRYEYEVRSINGVQQYETGVGTRIPFCGFLDAPLIQSQQSSPPGKSRVTMDHNKLRTVSRKGVLKTIVPSSLTTRLLKSVHTQHHHPNISKMTRLISSQYYWQNMTQDIAKQVKTCPTCRFARRIDGYNQPSRLIEERERERVGDRTAVEGLNVGIWLFGNHFLVTLP